MSSTVHSMRKTRALHVPHLECGGVLTCSRTLAVSRGKVTRSATQPAVPAEKTLTAAEGVGSPAPPPTMTDGSAPQTLAAGLSVQWTRSCAQHAAHIAACSGKNPITCPGSGPGEQAAAAAAAGSRSINKEKKLAASSLRGSDSEQVPQVFPL